MSELIIAKFGGSSVKDAASMELCCDIINKNSGIKVVVVSATFNTTNQLEKLFTLLSEKKKEESRILWESISKRHLSYVSDLLGVSEQLENSLNETLQEGELLVNSLCERNRLSNQDSDLIYSLGERLSSSILGLRLQKTDSARDIILFDIRKVLKTDSCFNFANPEVAEIKKACDSFLKPLITDNSIIITQGFIGSDAENRTTTLGREGSDYSATLIGEALDASLVQIWTDVAGIASADPKLVKDVKFIETLNYDEASLMAHLGAKILFPKTLNPAKRKNIPVFVNSTFESQSKGTLITSRIEKSSGVKSICVKKRGRDYIISILGNNCDSFKINLPEVSRTSLSRSFLVEQAFERELSKIHQEFILNKLS